MDILRFATAGSVDDGKSTLIGRLLFDSKAIFEDQLAAVERTSRDRGEETTNLALLTDGLRAEREQGITIDVAYRYFATPQAQVHHRRHPGPHPVHQEHGDRRLDRRPGHHPGRRAQRPQRAVAAARLPDHAAAGAAPGARGEQDGPGRLRPGGLRGDQRRVLQVRGEARHHRPHVHPDLRAQRRQRRRAKREHALVRRPVAAAPPGARAHRLGQEPHRRAVPRPVRDQAAREQRPRTARLPGLRGPGGRRRAQAGRRGAAPAVGVHARGSARSSSRAGKSTRRSRPCR